MKRIHKTLLMAVVLFGGAGGAGVWVLKNKKTPEERTREELQRQRLFTGFGLVDVTAGELMTRGATLAFAKAEDGWTLTEPVRWPADAEALKAAINGMVAVRIDPETKESPPSDDQLAEWGLVKPLARLSLETEKGKKTLLVGPKNKLVDMYPITDGEHRAAGLAAKDFFFALDKPVDGFRERRVFPFSVKEVKRVRRLQANGGYVLERTTDGFRVASAAKDADTKDWGAADVDRARILLAALTRRLQIGRFLTDAYEGSEVQKKKYGLDAPRFSLTVATEGGEERTVAVGRVKETADEAGTTVMFVHGTKTVVEVPTEVTKDIPSEIAALRDRTIARFDRDDVAKVKIVQGTIETTIERSKDGSDWTITAPKRAPAKVWKVDDIVRVFSKLKAERFRDHKPESKELAEWLLDPPSRRLIFYDAGGEALGDVRIGKYVTEKELFAMATGSQRVGVITEAPVRILPEHPEDLVDADRVK